MARGTGRVQSPAASRGLTNRPLPPFSAVPTPLPSPLSLLEDLRLWHPDPDRGSMTIGNRYASVTVHSRPIIKRSKTFARWGFGRGLPIGVQVPVGIQYANAFNVVNCIRRKVRRGVIFARGKAGSGKRQRMPRRTWRSAIWC